MKSLTGDSLNTSSDHRKVNFYSNFNYAKVELNSSDLERNSSFPDNLREELGDNFFITQNDCHHTEFYPCV